MFRRWLDDAVAAGLHEPNAMVVSTVSADGAAVLADGAAQGPRRRRLRVLHQLRVAQGRGAGGEPGGARCSSRGTTSQRQVRVEGTAARVSAEENEAYFAEPPARLPARRLGIAAVAGGAVPGGPRRAVRRGLARFADGTTGSPCRRTGVATGSPRTPWSSGRAARAGCTTGSATAVPSRPDAPGRWSGSPPDPAGALGPGVGFPGDAEKLALPTGNFPWEAPEAASPGNRQPKNHL